MLRKMIDVNRRAICPEDSHSCIVCSVTNFSRILAYAIHSVIYSPMSGSPIPASPLSEHIRISMLDEIVRCWANGNFSPATGA
jgi:hypothetical protein